MRTDKRNAHLVVLPALTSLLAVVTLAAHPTSGRTKAAAAELFVNSDKCQACHNNLEVRAGEDLSIGVAWRATMMAHSAVDPYWLAGVRRETIDHPAAAAAIEDKCSTCHMPIARFLRRDMGIKGNVFADTAAAAAIAAGPTSPEAQDGVSCATCHQIASDNLGREESFTGGFEVDVTTPLGERGIFGPFKVAKATRRVMRSASGFEPREGAHVQGSELCATCHTLYTHALDDQGNEIGEFPEQMPYLEWLHSDYAASRVDPRTCQDCHMPAVHGATPVSSVLGPPREQLSRHAFRGGNFFVLGLLGRNRAVLGARALPQEIDRSVRSTNDHLQSSAADIVIAGDGTEIVNGTLVTDVVVENLAGHKLPTAYPSRRVWIHLTVRDAAGNAVFESGALESDGSISGNDNDRDGTRFEPHYRTIDAADQVQIYEAVMQTKGGAITTGLMEAFSYAKDNRVTPLGFDKSSADPDVAVRGAALDDASFAEGRDRVRYAVAVDEGAGAYTVTAELWYQPVGYRWAKNLEEYDAPEPRAFVEMYDEFPKQDTAILLASDTMTVEPPPPPPVVEEDPGSN